MCTASPLDYNVWCKFQSLESLMVLQWSHCVSKAGDKYMKSFPLAFLISHIAIIMLIILPKIHHVYLLDHMLNFCTIIESPI